MNTLIRSMAIGAFSCMAVTVLDAQGVGGKVPAAISAIRESDIKRDLFAMASDTMRGREGGTLDELRASVWVADQYRAIGLKPLGEDGTWFQWFWITRTRVSTPNSSVQLGGRDVPLWSDIIPLGVFPAEGTGAVLWIADASDTTSDVRGRVVATPLLTPAPAGVRPTSYPYPIRYVDAAVNGTMARFARRGASAIILVADHRADSAFDAIASMRVRGAYDVDRAVPRAAGGSERVAPIPALGAGATPSFLARARWAETLRSGATIDMHVRLERFEVPSVNIIGMVRGTDPVLRNEYVIFSSHQDANGVRYPIDGDSTYRGADDNASVSVAELAAARAFVRAPSKRSVLFIHHGAEERGLLGSRYHAAHPVVPLAKVVAVINGDMIGRNNPDTAALLGSQPPHRTSKDLVEMALRANALTGKFVVDSSWDRPTHSEGWYFRSDHLPYARMNVPSLMYSTNLHDDYHTPNDSPQRIDYPKLTRMAKWMYLTGWFAANAAQRPRLDENFKLER